MASGDQVGAVKAIRFFDPSYNPGIEKPQFCNQISTLPTTLDKLSDDYLKKLIDNMTNSNCKNTLDILIKTNIKRERSEGGGFLLGGYGPAFGATAITASNEKNSGSEDLGSSSSTEGCLTQIMQDFSQLSLSLGNVCRSTESTSLQTFDSTQSVKLTIEAAPTPEQSSVRFKETKDFNKTVLGLASNTILDSKTKQYFMDELAKTELAKVANFNFGITNSQFKILVDNQQNLTATNNLSISSDDEQKEAMENTLKSQLTNDLKQKYGLGSAQLGSISEVISERIKTAREDRFDAIIALANEHKIVVNQDGSLTMLVRGPINRVTLDLTAKNMSFLRSEAVIKEINTLSKDISDKLIYDILNGNISSIEAEGLAD